MFGGSIKVASIGGIAIEIQPSWFIILIGLSAFLALVTFPDRYDDWNAATYWIAGIAAAVLLFVTVLIHELAHAVVAIRRGIGVPRITLFIFGGVSHLDEQPRSAGEEFKIAAAGPAMSLVIALGLGAAWLLLRDSNQQLDAMLFYLASVNLTLAVFNILPGFPLDGGRVLRSIIWKRSGSFRKATRMAAGVGELFGWGLIGLGVVMILTISWIGLWGIAIGWFLLTAARGEAQGIQMDTILSKLRARDLMHDRFEKVTPGTAVQEVVDDYMVGKGERAVVIANDDFVLGILTVTDINRVPRSEWDSVPAQRIMTPRAEIVTVDADAPALDVMPLLGQRRLNQVPVIEDGRMIGLITRREFLDRVQLAEELSKKSDQDPEDDPPPIRTSSSGDDSSAN